jgi:hypothetical protein
MKLEWTRAPVKTQWGHDMFEALIAIDDNHTLSLYCERNQTEKVEAMINQRTWVGLTKDEVETLSYQAEGNTWKAVELAEAKLKEKNT